MSVDWSPTGARDSRRARERASSTSSTGARRRDCAAGRGLGLAIARGIVEVHGGQIVAEPRARRRGSVPVHPAARRRSPEGPSGRWLSGSPPRDAARRPPPPARSCCVIEDEPPIRRFLRLLAREPGLSRGGGRDRRGQRASPGRHAPARPRRALDLGPPDLDGIDGIIRRLRGTEQPVPTHRALGPRVGESDRSGGARRRAPTTAIAKPFARRRAPRRARVAPSRSGPGAGARRVVRSRAAEHLRGWTLGRRRVWLAATNRGCASRRSGTKLLAVLVRHAGKVLTHRQLTPGGLGPGQVGPDALPRVYMAGLRRRLEADHRPLRACSPDRSPESATALLAE